MKDIINVNLDPVVYSYVVEEIAENYFDSDGKYVPHYGLMNAMYTFYNMCVKEIAVSKKINDKMSVLEIVNVLSKDDAFMRHFNEATCNLDYNLDFANAFRDALGIVDSRKTSLNYFADRLISEINSIADKLVNFASEENIEKLNSIAKLIAAGDANMVDSFRKSDRLKEILAEKKE